ncbi:MAG: linoleoyl-CoA desaturase [Sphingobacteriales bacterium]|jgi:linoleoyl-CoA desaturase
MLKSTTSLKKVKYNSNPRKDEFFRVLKERVYSYFKDNDISPYANANMYFKTAFAVVSWAGIYALIMSNVLSSSLGLLVLAFTVLGFVNIFIAFNIMHDANHFAYSKSKKVNKWMGLSMNFIGGNAYLFTQMHNAHHAFVNIHGIDVTLESHGLFRFTPHEPWQPKHKWQHIYTPMIYALAMIHWVTIKDFKWFFFEHSIGNTKNIKHTPKELMNLIFGKITYFGLTLVLPLIFIEASAWWIVFAWINLHILPSLTFALIFQVTHVYDGTHYPLPSDEGSIENNYAIHVLETTADFSRKRKVASWFMGGINIHVIHHLFPQICHVHYAALTDIVEETAREHGLLYQENPSFWVALKKHMKILHHLSAPEAEVPQYGPSAVYV